MAFNPKKIFLSSLFDGCLDVALFGVFSHLFEDHEHKTCEIYQTHLHELELDCDILDYQFAPSVQISTNINCSIVYASQQKKLIFSTREILFL